MASSEPRHEKVRASEYPAINVLSRSSGEALKHAKAWAADKHVVYGYEDHADLRGGHVLVTHIGSKPLASFEWRV